MSVSAYNQGPDIAVVMITSSARVLAQPEFGDVVIQDWRAAGLPRPSVIRAGRLFALESRLVTMTYGDLTAVDLAALDLALRLVVNLP